MRVQSKFGLSNSVVKFRQARISVPWITWPGHAMKVKGIVNVEHIRWHSIKETHDGFLYEQPERANERFPEKSFRLSET
jgi:hypothetical protein